MGKLPASSLYHSQLEVLFSVTEQINRRSLVKGAAWAAPVVATSAAIPAYAASQCTPDPSIFTRNFYHYNSAWDNGGYVQNGSYTYKFYSFDSTKGDTAYGTIDTCVLGLCEDSVVTDFKVTLWVPFSSLTFNYGPGNYTAWSPLVRDTSKSSSTVDRITYYAYTTTYGGSLTVSGTSACIPVPFTFESARTGQRTNPIRAIFERTVNVDGQIVRNSSGPLEYTSQNHIIRT